MSSTIERFLDFNLASFAEEGGSAGPGWLPLGSAGCLDIAEGTRTGG